MANKKIIVLKMRELIYTGIFVFFGVVLIILLLAMFAGERKNKPKLSEKSNSEAGNTTSEETTEPVFRPGVYTTDITLANDTMTLQLLVDADRVKAVKLLPLPTSASSSESQDTGTEYLATMYPLMEPALDVIEGNLAEGIPLENISFSVENQYTGNLLVQSLLPLLEKARLED